jgi:hypothetical protein
VIAGVLVAGGAAVLLFGLTPFGASCALPERTPWLVWLGMPIAAAGVAVRVMKPRDLHARWLVVGGAVLVIIGMLLPHTDARPSLPGEYVLYMRDTSLLDKSLLGASVDGFDQDVMVRFLSMWHLLGIGLVVGAAALTIHAHCPGTRSAIARSASCWCSTSRSPWRSTPEHRAGAVRVEGRLRRLGRLTNALFAGRRDPPGGAAGGGVDRAGLAGPPAWCRCCRCGPSRPDQGRGDRPAPWCTGPTARSALPRPYGGRD